MPAIYLAGIARQLVEILTARSGAIAGCAPEKSEPRRFHGGRHRQFLAALHRQHGLPSLPAPLRNRGGHPEELYSAMLTLAGSLTTFSSKVHLAICHLTITTIWEVASPNLMRSCACCSRPSSPAMWFPAPQTPQASIYATALDHDKYLVNTKMYLAVSAETSQAEIVAKTPTS
jgi:type VI secretion system protein ImpJ